MQQAIEPLCFQVSTNDDDSTKLLQNMVMGVRFVREALDSGGNVLMHCLHGVNRSGAMLIGYLMMDEELSYEEVSGVWHPIPFSLAKH